MQLGFLPGDDDREKDEQSARAFVPDGASLDELRDAARGCRGCDLFRFATQTVFGEGPARARLLFVGEQPGDSEDIHGRPFVGPAGALLRSSLAEAGIDERDVPITNAVKHFKFTERGKRRIHATPNVTEVRACAQPWRSWKICVGWHASSRKRGTIRRLRFVSWGKWPNTPRRHAWSS